MDTQPNSFSYQTLDGLVEACIKHYRNRLERGDKPEAHRRRSQLAEWVKKFHEEGQTLSLPVQESLDHLCSGRCLLLMTAHQPNLFAYGGVLRKATLNHVLATKLSERLGLPVVSLFGIADQDFTDDRWVHSALLPDVERREGMLELRVDLPEKMMLNKVSKPPNQVLNSWRSKIVEWFTRKLGSIERGCRGVCSDFDARRTKVMSDFNDFWKVVEDAYAGSSNYADFNGFLLSKVVNDAWEYDTLFARFSECQQIFRDEFRYLISEFEGYSEGVKETVVSHEGPEKGVYSLEWNTIPFWHHCSCGSKARLIAEREGNLLSGRGKCLHCGREHTLVLGSKNDVNISEYLSEISARTLSMPLVFFEGLGVACYVGGVGGREYLQQARHVAGKMGLRFPPTVVWRPRDRYLGLGQLDARVTFRRLSGTADLSQHLAVLDRLRVRIADVQKRIADIELQKSQLKSQAKETSDVIISQLKDLSAKQNKIRRATNLPVTMRNCKLMENIESVMRMYPCMLDYAVNVGMRATSEQWVSFLEENGDLSSDVFLRTDFDDLAQHMMTVES